MSAWKQRAVEGMKEVFTKGAERARGDHEAESRNLHAKIGELTVERDIGGMIDCPEYTLTLPPPCPRKWDHLTGNPAWFSSECHRT